MKTPLQELLERVQEYRDAETSPLVVSRLNSVCVDILGMLEKEKDVMCDFVEYCDEANRNYQETEESWCEDLTIDDMFDKRFNKQVK